MKEKIVAVKIVQPSFSFGSLGSLLLLLLPLLAFSQTTKVNLKDDVKHPDSLITVSNSGIASLLPVAHRDSLALAAALDSLQQKGYPLSQFTHKADSLRQAFTTRSQKALGTIQEKTQKAITALNPVQQILPNDLLPPQAATIINQVPVKLPDGIPPVPGLNTDQLGLPHTPLPAVPSLSNLPNSAALSSQLKNQVTEGAKDFFAHHQQELNEARRKLARYNGRLEKIDNLQDLKGKYLILNPLKDKPWPERVLLGTTWQFSNQKQYHIDLGPNIAWRVTDLFSFGAGFQYRLSVSIKHQPWINSSDKVYGYQLFSDVQIKKGFFGRVQYDNLQTMVPRVDAVTKVESVEQQWVKGLSVGVGKSYSFYKKVNGYSLLQYNLMHKQGESPYLRPLQVKIGFYINSQHLVKKKS